MLKLFKIIQWIGLLFLVLFFHFFISYFFPFPYNAIQVFMVAVIIRMIMHQSGTIVWFAFFVLLCLDIFAAHIFGLQLVAGTLATLILFWIYEYLFTNKSWFSAGVLSCIGIMLYRCIYALSIAILSFTEHPVLSSVSWNALFSHLLLEIVGTSVMTIVVFLILRPFFIELQSQKVTRKIFN